MGLMGFIASAGGGPVGSIVIQQCATHLLLQSKEGIKNIVSRFIQHLFHNCLSGNDLDHSPISGGISTRIPGHHHPGELDPGAPLEAVELHPQRPQLVPLERQDAPRNC